jgi:hypothetical protein
MDSVRTKLAKARPKGEKKTPWHQTAGGQLAILGGTGLALAAAKHGPGMLRAHRINKWNKAGRAYARAGGPRAHKKVWAAYKKTGDKAVGKYGHGEGKRRWAQAKAVLGSEHDVASKHRKALGRVDELLPGLKGAKTKGEASKIFQAASRKHHPDVGGSKETFQQMKDSWDAYHKGHGPKPSGLALPMGKTGMAIPGFWNELEKIGRTLVDVKKLPKTPPVLLKDPGDLTRGYGASFMAHELGHAQDFENRKVPKLRKSIERGIMLGGTVASIASQIQGRPGAAALTSFLADAPGLADEAIASYKGMKNLRKSGKFNDAELKKMRNHLLAAGSTYLGQAAVSAGMAAGTGALVKQRGFDEALTLMPPGTSNLAKLLMGVATTSVVNRAGKKVPVIRPEVAESLRGQMSVKAPLYRGGKALEGNAAYVHKADLYPDSGRMAKWWHGVKADMINGMLHDQGKGKDRKTALKILAGGGIVVPQHEIKRKRDLKKTAEKEYPTKGKRLAKGLALGGLTGATALGVLAATNPGATKQIAGRLRGRLQAAIARRQAIKAGVKLAEAQYWSALADTLTR